MSVPKEEVNKLLHEMADHIEKVGWRQQNYYAPLTDTEAVMLAHGTHADLKEFYKTRCCCLIGAARIVDSSDFQMLGEDTPGQPVYDAALEEIVARIRGLRLPPPRNTDFHQMVVKWNDKYGRTKEEVLQVLRAEPLIP